VWRCIGSARLPAEEAILGLHETLLTPVHVVAAVVEGAEAGTTVAAKLAVHVLRHATRSGHRHGSWPGVLGETLRGVWSGCARRAEWVGETHWVKGGCGSLMICRHRLIGSICGKSGRPVDSRRWPGCGRKVVSVTSMVAVVDIAWCAHARVMRVAAIGYHAMRLA
jgi:hypothetical protein